MKVYKRKLGKICELFKTQWPNISLEGIVEHYPDLGVITEDLDPIALDLETTGLDEIVAGIASIGAVNTRTGATFYREIRVDKDCEVSERSLEVNGFSKDELYDESKPDVWTVMGEFTEWYYLNSGGLLLGQNLNQFDMPFLKQEFKIHNAYFPFGYHYLDLHSMVYQDSGLSLSLANAAEHYEVKPEPNPHNALEGAKCTARVYRELQKRVSIEDTE